MVIPDQVETVAVQNLEISMLEIHTDTVEIAREDEPMVFRPVVEAEMISDTTKPEYE